MACCFFFGSGPLKNDIRSETIRQRTQQRYDMYTLPETNSKFAPENWWLEDEFPPIFRGYILLLVSGRVVHRRTTTWELPVAAWEVRVGKPPIPQLIQLGVQPAWCSHLTWCESHFLLTIARYYPQNQHFAPARRPKRPKRKLIWTNPSVSGATC